MAVFLSFLPKIGSSPNGNMPTTRSGKLTPEQEALISDYCKKWRAIAVSREPINPQKAKEAVKAGYQAIGLEEPEILFFDSPYAALSAIESQLWTPLKDPVENQLRSQLISQVESQLTIQLKSQLWNQLLQHQQVGLRVSQQVSQLKTKLNGKLDNQLLNYCISPKFRSCYDSYLDFCISVLNCTHDPEKWQVLQSLVKDCGWVFSFEITCLVCTKR